MNAVPQGTIVLAAPSGYGKTTAVAQLVKAHYPRVIWIDLDGQRVSEEELLRLICAEVQSEYATVSLPNGRPQEQLVAVLAEVAATTSRRLALVLDDARLSHSAVDDLVSLGGLIQSVSEEARIVVTSRTVEPSVPPSIALVTSDLLRFSRDEVRLLLRDEQAHVSEETITGLLAATHGQAALLALCVPDLLCADPRTASPHQPVWTTPRLRSHLLWLARCRLDDDERRVLYAAALLAKGSMSWLTNVVPGVDARSLQEVADGIPLFSVSASDSTFLVHSIAQDVFLSPDFVAMLRGSEELLSDALRQLGHQRRYTRLAWLITTHLVGAAKCAALDAWGEVLHSQSLLTPTRSAIESVPPALLLSHPRIILLHARVLSDQLAEAEAQERALVAKCLAEADEDWDLVGETVLFLAIGLLKAGRELQAEEMLCQANERLRQSSTGDVRALLLGLHALVAATVGKGEVCSQRLTDIDALDERSMSAETVAKLLLYRGLALSIRSADFDSACMAWRRALETQGIPESLCLTIQTNLAGGYVMRGRTRLAKTLVQSLQARAANLDMAAETGNCSAVQGLVAAAEEDYEDALRAIRGAIQQAEASGAEWYANHSRLDLAVVLRAAGAVEESLVECEGVVARLLHGSSHPLSVSAKVEMAASLLACGERDAGVKVLAALTDSGEEVDRLSLLKINLLEHIAGVADSDECASTSGRGRELIVSGNATWHIAMYIRTFPDLLPVVRALAGGASAVPRGLMDMLAASIAGSEGLSACGESSSSMSCACHARLLGAHQVSIRGQTIPASAWRKRKARVLFAMLAVRRGQDVPRDQILEHLWPDMDEERARNNFYVVWSAMKAALMTGKEKGTPCPYVENVHGACRIIRENVRLDIDEFDEQIESARQAEAEGRPDEALAAYERVAELYRGQLLPGDLYDDWFAGVREHYRCEFTAAMTQAARLRYEAGDADAALRFIRAALAQDPWREDLYQAAIRYQMATGQRGAAIETYLACRSRLAEDLGLDPSSEMRSLYDQILAMEEPAPTAS